MAPAGQSVALTDFHPGGPQGFWTIPSTDPSDKDRTAGNRVRALQRDGAASLPRSRRFLLVRFADIKRDQRRQYLVKGLNPRGGLIVVWGPPKCGKSFWVSDLALH